MKTNFDFFRLDTSFFSNKKIKTLRRRYGSIGILTYLYILAYTYGNDGYYLKFKSLEDLSYDIAESINNTQLDRTASVVTECILYLASETTLSEKLLARGCITGENIQRQYIEMCKASKRKVEILPEYRLVDTQLLNTEKIPISSEEMSIYSEEMSINSEKMRQSKVKEIDCLINNINIKTKHASACACESEEWNVFEWIEENLKLVYSPQTISLSCEAAYGTDEIISFICRQLDEILKDGESWTVVEDTYSFATVEEAIKGMSQRTFIKIVEAFYFLDKVSRKYKRREVVSPKAYILSILLKADKNEE